MTQQFLISICRIKIRCLSIDISSFTKVPTVKISSITSTSPLDTKTNDQETLTETCSDVIDTKTPINGNLKTTLTNSPQCASLSEDLQTMDRSVDSIGTCSLDVEVSSADLSGTHNIDCVLFCYLLNIIQRIFWRPMVGLFIDTTMVYVIFSVRERNFKNI